MNVKKQLDGTSDVCDDTAKLLGQVSGGPEPVNHEIKVER
jgi:hypothetical protein